MTLVAVVLACTAFLVALRVSRLERLTLDVVSSCRTAVAAMHNASLDDAEKERLVQHAAVRLMKHFVAISFLGAAVLAVPVLVLLALDALKIAPFQAAVGLSLRWEVIAGTSLAAVVVWLARR